MDEIQSKVLRVFPPCYSQSSLQLCLEISISSNKHSLLQFYNSVTLHFKRRNCIFIVHEFGFRSDQLINLHIVRFIVESADLSFQEHGSYYYYAQIIYCSVTCRVRAWVHPATLHTVYPHYPYYRQLDTRNRYISWNIISLSSIWFYLLGTQKLLHCAM